MPQRWGAPDRPTFLKKYGGGVKWCRTASYHLLIINGFSVLRIWTNAKKKTMVEVSDRLATTSSLTQLFELVHTPKDTTKRRDMFSWRFHLETPAELHYLMVLVRVMYGVDNT